MLSRMSSLTAHDSDHAAVTEGCGLLDRSERGKLALTGDGAKSFLQGQVSNDVDALTPGTGCYAAFLTPKGKMLGDLRILDAGPQPAEDSASGLAGTGDGNAVQLILLDTERIALQELFNMIRRFSVGYDLELHKRTVQSGLLSLIGPGAGDIAAVPELGPDEDDHVPASIDGSAVRAVRTDVGIDLLCDAEQTEALRAALEARGARPVSEGAAEVIRVEHGRPRYGIDLDDTVIPQEADLNGRAVSFTKGCYVGQETVARLFYRGKPNRRLQGLRLSEPVAGGSEISFEGRVVGRVTSAVQSPSHGPIALTLVRREAPTGSHVAVGDDGVTAIVVELPFAE